MVTAVVETSPLRQRQRLRSSPLSTTTSGGGGDLESRHWRPAVKRVSAGMRRRWAPPEIEIPKNGTTTAGAVVAVGGARGGSYTSLRDIMSSPEYAKQQQQAAAASSPDEAATTTDVHMIRHPLLKHAAYAYLQLTPAAREERARLLRRRRGGPLCRFLEGCLGFLGALFGR